MANKQIEMRKVKQIFKLYSEGVSKRQISSRLGLSRNTITKYIAFFKRYQLTLSQASPLSFDDVHPLAYPFNIYKKSKETFNYMIFVIFPTFKITYF